MTTDDASASTGELTAQEIKDLLAALDDEYKAHTTYRQVIADFGEVRPFSNIVEAEHRHIGALLVLFERYGVPVPQNPWVGRVPRYSSIAQACQASVEDEINNAALYDRVLLGTDRTDLITTYKNLQRASQENHLPAFERCAERHQENTEEDGRGHQRRRRRGEKG